MSHLTVKKRKKLNKRENRRDKDMKPRRKHHNKGKGRIKNRAKCAVFNFDKFEQSSYISSVVARHYVEERAAGLTN